MQYNQSPIRFTKLIYEVDAMIKKAFKADSVRVVFLPYPYQLTGIFMQGQYNKREMYKIDLKGTTIFDILQSPGCR